MKIDIGSKIKYMGAELLVGKEKTRVKKGKKIKYVPTEYLTKVKHKAKVKKIISSM